MRSTNEPEAGEHNATFQNRRQRVVFVDDDETFRGVVQDSLARYAKQLELALFSNANAALVYVPRHAVDLVVLDLYMPGTNGIQACRYLRTSGVASPLVVITGNLTSALKDASYEAGATYALEKPIDFVELIGAATRTNLALAVARERLVADHLELARNIAGKLARKYAAMLDPEDVQGPAMVGLCEAAARFEPARSEPFIAFAARRIRGAVLDEIRRLGAHGRVTYKRQRKISGARRAILHNGSEPTDDRIAARLGLSVSTVQEASVRRERVTEDVASLPSPAPSPAVQVEHTEVLALLARARETLPEPEATVIRLHYDLGLSWAKVAQMLELTPTHVAQLHATGVAMLQSGLREGRPRDREPCRATTPSRFRRAKHNR